MQKINNKILLETIKLAEGEFLPLQFVEKQELIEEIVQKFDKLNNAQTDTIELTDMDIVTKYIQSNSSSPEVDLVKIKENQEFFKFMLQLAKDSQENIN